MQFPDKKIEGSDNYQIYMKAVSRIQRRPSCCNVSVDFVVYTAHLLDEADINTSKQLTVFPIFEHISYFKWNNTIVYIIVVFTEPASK